jgi:DEAD/DEAH box helicase domain-containing protein
MSNPSVVSRKQGRQDVMSHEPLTKPSVQLDSPAVPVAELIAAADEAVGGAIGSVELPANPGATAPWPNWADPALLDALQRRGIEQPWQHQVAAADLAHTSHNVVIATGTASGKSLAYWLPVLSELNSGRGTALYCTPTKALAQDQLARILELDLSGVTAACYDGDTPKDVRPWIRRNGNYILTNPDMLHRSILPDHQRWTSFLRRLQYVILDEGHSYRGVFGSHMAAIMRRLHRLAKAAGAEPTFIVTSATLAQPQDSAAALLGQPVTAITQDTSTKGATTVLIADPPPEDGGAFGSVAATLAAWTSAGVRSLGFIRSRAGAESLAKAVTERLPAAEDAAAVAPYRGGLLPEERRDIESRLRNGQLRCVATTNALELGVDISGLDAVALCGWPGRRSSFLQQVGRAGREGTGAVAVLVAQQDPLDQFYARHPEQILAEGVEAAVFDPANPYVLIPHLAAAIAEQPLTAVEAEAVFGPAASDALAALAGKRLIRQRGDRWFWVDRARASDLADLRSTGASVTVIEADTARVLGTVDRAAAPAQVHPGAVYVHLGVIHLIESLDLEQGVAVAHRENPGYTTVAQSVSDLQILATAESRPSRAGTMHFGDVEVGGQVVSFLRRRAGTGEVLGSEPLDMPRQQLRTRAVWWQLPDPDLLNLAPQRIAGAAHAAEHAAIGILPALATCDRWDIGGLSTERHPDTGELSIFIYDGHPGGAGFARRGFEEARRWLGATRDVVSACPCHDGCPGCVQSPKCGNGNEPLDKAGAVKLLELLRPSAP